jgi:ATP-dependent 26S proteasome regulatory subunit
MTEETLTPQKEHEKALKQMGTVSFTSDLLSLLRSRAPLIYLTCNEEKRMKIYFKHLAASEGYKIYIWDCFLGLLDLMSEKKSKGITDDLTQPTVVLDKIIEQAQQDEDNAKSLKSEGIRGTIYILLDFHRFMEEAVPDLERRLKTFSNIESMTHIIMTGPYLVTTPTLEDSISVLDFPYPNSDEISCALNSLVSAIKKQGKLPNLEKETEEHKDEIIKAANGLTLNEAQMAFSKSVVMNKTFSIPVILKEKQQIIRKKGILEFFEPKVSMKDIGGLKHLVNWLERRKLSFHSDAKKYGLPSLRGIMLLGGAGTGKSLTCKAIAGLYQLPLLRLDFGKLFGSLVGQSEATVRDMIRLAENISPAVLWIDEIEKGLSGSRSSGQTDGGTTSRVVSTFLTWLQEKEAPVFVVCTANDYSTIPPEFMRAGRLDEVFFVDLPTKTERKDIYKVLFKKHNRDPLKFDIDSLASVTENYSGAEIEKSIVSALFEGFSDNKREITTKDVSMAVKSFKPLYDIRQEEFDEMRDWAKGRCVMANSDEEDVSATKEKEYKNLDL